MKVRPKSLEGSSERKCLMTKVGNEGKHCYADTDTQHRACAQGGFDKRHELHRVKPM